MDFLYSRDRRDQSVMEEVLAPFANDYPAKRLYIYSGDWGCIVSSGSQYRKLDPYEDQDVVALVSGDPLCGVLPSKLDERYGRSTRTSAILRHWKQNDDRVVINNPAAFIIVSKRDGSVTIHMDAWGAVPVYIWRNRDELAIGSSPDLLAGFKPSTFDRSSAIEKICSGQIAFPNTLYASIKELTPGAITRIDHQRIGIQRWWTAPRPDVSVSIAEWSERLDNAIKDTLSRIASEVSTEGMMTLSAGLDGRYLASVIQEQGLLKISAINLSAYPNVKRYVARRVARRLNIPLILQTRPTDHYAKVLLHEHPEIGSSVLLSDAHFAEKSLGELDGLQFLIGGYMADSILAHEDNFTVDKTIARNTGLITSEAPYWAVNSAYEQIEPSEQLGITERWIKADALLGLDSTYSESMRHIMPLSRQGTKGCFEAARRSYPMYEPFMSRQALELGFRLPEQIKAQKNKRQFYGHYLDQTSDIPVNPDIPINPKTHGRRTLLFRATRKLRLYRIPVPLPESLTPGGEWDEVPGPLHGVAQVKLRELRDTVEQALSLSFDPDIRSNNYVFVSIGFALGRSKH